MDLLGTVPPRFGAITSLSDLDPEYVVGLRGLKGRVWYVDSNNATPAGSRDGRSWAGAVTSLATLMTQSDAPRADDIVCVAPLHLETIVAAAGVALNKAGVTYIGYGNGNRCPQVNFTTVVGATMTVTGAGVRIANFRFTGGLDALTSPVSLAAADLQLLNIITEDVTGQAIDFIVTTAACDRLLISGWQHRGDSAAGADTAISLVGGNDWTIEDFSLYGNFAVAGIENVTTAANRVRIGGGARWNYIWTENSADIAVTMVATSIGHIGPNINAMLQDNAANVTEAFAGAAMQFWLPLNVVNLAGEASMVTNITPSTDA